MKTFDLKSLIIGVLLTMMVVVVMLIATANSAPVAWEYQVVHPVYVGPADLQSRMNSAGNDGWEVVSVGVDAANRSFVVMKRPKAVQRPSWWKFWKK